MTVNLAMCPRNTELASRVKAIYKLIKTAFAVVLTVSGGLITGLRMLDDSFAVAAAAWQRPGRGWWRSAKVSDPLPVPAI